MCEYYWCRLCTYTQPNASKNWQQLIDVLITYRVWCSGFSSSVSFSYKLQPRSTKTNFKQKHVSKPGSAPLTHVTQCIAWFFICQLYSTRGTWSQVITAIESSWSVEDQMMEMWLPKTSLAFNAGDELCFISNRFARYEIGPCGGVIQTFWLLVHWLGRRTTLNQGRSCYQI